MHVVSSTPTVEIQPSKNKSQKSATPKRDENKNRISAQIPLTFDDFENSYLGYLMNTKGVGQLPLSPPNKSLQQSGPVKKASRRTIDLENRTEKSPEAIWEKENTMHGRQLKVRLKRVSLIGKDVPDSAVQLDKFPETLQQAGDGIAADPTVPVLQDNPVSVKSPSASQPATLHNSPSVLPATELATSSVLPSLPKENPLPKSPVATPPSTQTVSSPKQPPPANVSCGIQTSCNLLDASQQKEVVPNDDVVESVGQQKLKPSEGGKIAKLQLRTQTEAESASKGDELVLDLHNYRQKKKNLALDKARSKSVLNKPTHPEINGEQFAKELAKMSNYEIIDLRKRNSVGMLNGHLSEDQHIVEQKIQQELSRRKLEDNESSSTNKTVAHKLSKESVLQKLSPVGNLKPRTNRRPPKMVL